MQQRQSQLKDDHDIMHISVVVPFHNAERYIAECVEGILSQRYPTEHYEIVMVDNNSTDASAEIVKCYSRVRLVSEEKQGAYAARNRGLREAKGEIIAFTDSDCVPSSNWLQEIKAAMSHPDVGIVIGRLRLAQDSFILSMLADYENEKSTYTFNSEIEELYYAHAGNMAVRKRLFDEIGLFLERARGSDTIFVRRWVDKHSCKAVCYSPEAQVRHMEIDSISKYFRKVSIYGSSRQKYKHIICARPLTNWERFLIFRRAVQSQRYSWIKSVFLLGLLAIGLVYWVLGSISDTWNFRQKVMP
jgi:glycosyltransferase involved in cell wall biosynthesis